MPDSMHGRLPPKAVSSSRAPYVEPRFGEMLALVCKGVSLMETGLVDCPVCGLPSEPVQVWVEQRDGGKVPRILVRCPSFHWVAMDRVEWNEMAVEQWEV